MRVYCILQSLSKKTSHFERKTLSLGIFGYFPSWAWIVFLNLFPCVCYFFFFAVPTFHLCLLLIFSSPSFFSVFTNCFLALVHKGTSPPIPLHFSLVPRYILPPSQFQYYLLFHVSSLLIWFLLVFLSFSPHYNVPSVYTHCTW